MKYALYFLLSFLTIFILCIHTHHYIENRKQNREDYVDIAGDTIKDTRKKIAFCFLTVNDVKHAKMWDVFFKNNEDKYNIYVHPKNKENITSFFKYYIINEHVKTAWGHISLTDATYLMLKEGLSDENNMKFILLSDSCIPIKSFQNVYQSTTKDNKSWFNYYRPDITSSPTHFKRIGSLPLFLAEKAYIQEQWMILDRSHVELIVKNYMDFRKYFTRKSQIPDECLFITLLNYLEPNLKKQLKFQKHDRYNYKIHDYITFAEWFDEDGELRISFHPFTFETIDSKIVDKLKNCKSLFARKFAEDSNIFEFHQELLQ